MSIEWKLAFLNTDIIIFSLIYLLNILDSNQNPSFFYLIPFFFSCIPVNGEVVTRKWFWHYFRVILLLPRETELCLVFITNSRYMAYLSFLGSQVKPNWVLRFINCYGKGNRETHALVQWHMIGHRLFVSAPMENAFYLHAELFEIPR